MRPMRIVRIFFALSAAFFAFSFGTKSAITLTTLITMLIKRWLTCTTTDYKATTNYYKKRKRKKTTTK